SLSPSKIVSGEVNEHGIRFGRQPNIAAAVHSHGALDLPGASPDDVQTANDNNLPIYVVTPSGIILYDPNDRSTQSRISDPTNPNRGQPSFGIKVGDLSGKHSIFKKPCVN